MKPISDKEFDGFFQQQLLDAEIKPSDDLWKSIEKELNIPKRRKTPVFWLIGSGIAAAILLLVLLLPDKEVIKLYQTNIAVSNIQTQDEKIGQENLLSNTLPSKQIEKKAKITLVKLKSVKLVDNKTVDLTIKKNQIMQPNSEINHLVVNTDKNRMELKGHVLEEIKEKPKDYLAQVDTELVEELQLNIKDETVKDKKPTLRNIGDLVNMVVDKIDRRERKIIRFNTDDDDNSSLSLNISFLKLNRKDR